MLEFISSLPTFDDDDSAKTLWNHIRDEFNDINGICYYRHPVLGTMQGISADLTLFSREISPVAIRCLPLFVEDIHAIEEEYWVVKDDKKEDSPVYQLDDFVVALESLIKIDRRLRRRLKPTGILALPFITKSEFLRRFKNEPRNYEVFWRGSNIRDLTVQIDNELSDEEWLSFRAVIQTALPLSTPSNEFDHDEPRTLGAALSVLNRQIKTLDLEQEKVAVQLPPGPQRIRGLAGTGKTVLFAMKAANIHRHHPEKKILFTFHTQSLYNQTVRWVRRFYGAHQNNIEPDWSKIHIRHAWGGRNKPGVYSDICSKNGTVPLTYRQANQLNSDSPFGVCCKHALTQNIAEEYDFVIVDEAQDFPQPFFEMLFRLSKSPHHRIYWAYDELQSLVTSSLALPAPEILFGNGPDGTPNVQFLGNDYPGGIQQDFVLNKAYRSPLEVLMLAHAIGLGLYSATGCVQMLDSADSWEAIGYEVQGDRSWKEDDEVTIHRPSRHSPNRINEIYTGKKQLVEMRAFDSRDSEFEWIAKSIAEDIQVEQVAPEDIAVIVLDAPKSKGYSSRLQMQLVLHNVASTIPGVLDETDTYAEEGRITISSVFRAKGNEASIVYIQGFEELYSYVDSIQNRNRAFTAISRSKAWVRISGVGPFMARAKKEIDAIRKSIPYFRFTFPNLEYIRNLDADTKKRRKKQQRINKIIQEIIAEPELFEAARPEMISQLMETLARQSSED